MQMVLGPGQWGPDLQERFRKKEIRYIDFSFSQLGHHNNKKHKKELVFITIFHKHMDVLISHPPPEKAQSPSKALLKLDTVGL